MNYSGSESDDRKLDSDLVGSLLRQGLVRPDPCLLGLDVDPHRALVNQVGEPSAWLYTLVPPKKGVLWETMAVPEIRLQAVMLAEFLTEAEPPPKPIPLS